MGRKRRIGYLSLVAAAALCGGLLSATPAQAAGEPVEIVVDGNDVKADNANGLTFKGLGLLSGNSTSNLLMDYKAESPEQYWQLVDVLFGGEYPLIDHIKMEMGSDTNNSTGAEAATMRTADELADASRSPGFQLAADAKTVNPDLKVSFLRWNMPEWVQTAWSAGTGKDEMYRWYKETILDAYEKYGYMVDYVDPDTNETSTPDTAFIKWYKNAIMTDTDFSDPRYGIPAADRAKVEAAYKRIKIVASDENTSKYIGPAMLTDSELFNAVDAVGYHYTTDDRHDGAADSATNLPYTKLATGLTPTGADKEVWYSEGVGSFGFTDYRVNNTEGPDGASTGIGGLQSSLDLANRIVKGYASSKRTHYIFQPAIGSFYEGAQYSHKELVSARDPWSGAIHYDAALYVMEHFTRFATVGWENDDNTAGIWRTLPDASYSGVSGTENLDGSNGAPSYMTLAAPDKSDFSTVVVNDSDQVKSYRIKADNMNLGSDKTMEAWETRASGTGDYDADFMHLLGETQPDSGGYYSASIAPRSIVTLTTLDRSSDPAMAVKLPTSVDKSVLDTDATGKNVDTTDATLYADDFEYAEEGSVPVGTADGAAKTEEPYLASRGDQPRYLVDQTGAWEVGDSPSGGKALYQYLDQSMKDTKAWNPTTPNTLVGDFRWQNYTASVDVSFPDGAGSSASLGVRQQTGMTAGDAAYNLRVQPTGAWGLYKHNAVVASGSVSAKDAYALSVTAAGATITAAIDGDVVSSYTDLSPELAGRVNLGSGWYTTAFDNLKITTVDGFAPYAAALTDNMDSAVAYTGSWSSTASNGDANDWYRSTSTSSSAGATATVPFSGTGIDLIGGNDGSAVIDISIDGKPLVRGAATVSTGKRQAFYTLRGLPDGVHTATITLASGKLVLDAFSAISGDVHGAVDTGVIVDALAEVGDPARSDYSDATWAVFAADRAAAEAARDGQPGLDRTGAAQIASRLTDAFDRLLPADITDTKKALGLTGSVTTAAALPATVLIDGTQRTVTWTNASVHAQRIAYATLSVEGWTNDAYVDGKKQAFTASYEVVPPALAYFIDSGLSTGQTSPQYGAVAGSSELQNDAADQVSTGASVWGYVADGMTVKSGTDPSDKYSTGIWAGGGKNVQYRLPLEPGDYTLTAGFREWWGQTRPMSESVTVGSTTVSGSAITLSSSASTATGTVKFTVTEPTTVLYKVAKTGSQDPVISWLAVAADVTAPSAPTAVSATAGDASATVSWTAPVSDGGSPITGYTVTSSPGGLSCTVVDATSCEVTGLTNGTDYTFTVVADNAAGASVASVASKAVTPVAPTPSDPAWVSNEVYLGGDRVSFDGRVFVAQWWTAGEKPDTTTTGAWAEVGAVTGCAAGPVLAWTSSWVYTGGETVAYAGHRWQAKWWTRNQIPGDPWGPWRDLGEC